MSDKPSVLLLLKCPSNRQRIEPTPLLNVEHLPLLSTSFNSRSLSDLSLELSRSHPPPYDGIVVCSKRAVQALETVWSSGLGSRTVPEAIRSLPHFAVGHETEKALKDLYSRHRDASLEGQEEEDRRKNAIRVIGAESGTGEQLARVIIDHFRQQSRVTVEEASDGNGNQEGKTIKLLFLCGDKGTEVLPQVLAREARGEIELVKIEVYRTQLVEGFEERFGDWISEQRENLIARDRSPRSLSKEGRGGLVWLGICSPSGGDQVVKILRRLKLVPPFQQYKDTTREDVRALKWEDPEDVDILRDSLRFVTIGKTTKCYLEEEQGVEVSAVAATPSEAGMITAVIEVEASPEQP